jgi:hypothetical protein
MSEKAMQIAQLEIINTIRSLYPDLAESEAMQLSLEVLETIDWKNPALMHKGISWITRFFLQNRMCA